MPPARNFLIRVGKEHQSLVANSMGRILEMPQTQEVVEQFGSRLVKRPGDYLNYIEPPLPRETLEKLGQALVDFAFGLVDEPPKPTYEINKISD